LPVYLVIDGSLATAAFHEAIEAGLADLWSTLQGEWVAGGHLRLAVVIATDAYQTQPHLVDLQSNPTPWTPAGAVALDAAFDAITAAIGTDVAHLVASGLAPQRPLVVVVTASADTVDSGARLRLIDRQANPHHAPEIIAYALDTSLRGEVLGIATVTSLAFAPAGLAPPELAVSEAFATLAQALVGYARVTSAGGALMPPTAPTGFQAG
jgi:uncharacterized protein YegL